MDWGAFHSTKNVKKFQMGYKGQRQFPGKVFINSERKSQMEQKLPMRY